MAELSTERGHSLAAAIIARNEERRIDDCLRSLDWADEIVVLDSYSTDRTVEIARRYTDRVFQNKFENYSKQRNCALNAVQSEWVLFVDADERVTVELAAEVRAAVRAAEQPSDGLPVDGYWVPRRNLIWGKWIRHAGWYPDYQLRLLRVRAAHYDESRAVHEVAQVPGATGYLTQPFIHYNYDTVGQFLAKQRAYSSHEARLLQDRGVIARTRNFIGAPAREFAYRYITLEGYKDGGHGLLLSVLLAWYKLQAYRKLARLTSHA